MVIFLTDSSADYLRILEGRCDVRGARIYKIRISRYSLRIILRIFNLFLTYYFYGLSTDYLRIILHTGFFAYIRKSRIFCMIGSPRFTSERVLVLPSSGAKMVICSKLLVFHFRIRINERNDNYNIHPALAYATLWIRYMNTLQRSGTTPLSTHLRRSFLVYTCRRPSAEW